MRVAREKAVECTTHLTVDMLARLHTGTTITF
jgi:hypothetical protein